MKKIIKRDGDFYFTKMGDFYIEHDVKSTLPELGEVDLDISLMSEIWEALLWGNVDGYHRSDDWDIEKTAWDLIEGYDVSDLHEKYEDIFIYQVLRKLLYGMDINPDITSRMRDFTVFMSDYRNICLKPIPRDCMRSIWMALLTGYEDKCFSKGCWFMPEHFWFLFQKNLGMTFSENTTAWECKEVINRFIIPFMYDNKHSHLFELERIPFLKYKMKRCAMRLSNRYDTGPSDYSDMMMVDNMKRRMRQYETVW